MVGIYVIYYIFIFFISTINNIQHMKKKILIHIYSQIELQSTV